jgi:hypothetical protein
MEGLRKSQLEYEVFLQEKPTVWQRKKDWEVI